MNTSSVFFLALIAVVFSADLIFERVEVYDVNPEFADNVTCSVKRTSRCSPYYLHMSARILKYAGNNVTIKAVAYEYLHNEYKRSFVEMSWTLCDVLYKEPWRTVVGTWFIANGAVCPAPPKFYNFLNMKLDINKFPAVLPFEKFMAQGYALFTPTQEIIGRARLYMRYDRDLPKGK